MATAPKVIPSDIGALTVTSLDGKPQSIDSMAGRTATVIVFIGNGCPTVRAYEQRLKALQDSWGSRGVSVIAVNANNPFLSPPDTPAEMADRAAKHGFNFPYVKDEGSRLAKHLGAVCTPHTFLLDRNFSIMYSGRIDDSRVGETITSRDLENAVADVVAGRSVAVARTEPFGCSIVW